MLTAIKPRTTRILSVHPQPNGLILMTESGRIRIMPYTEAILRISFTLEDNFPDPYAPGIVMVPETVSWTLEETEACIRFRTTRLVIEVVRETGAFRYLDAAGMRLTGEPAIGGKVLAPFESYRTVFDEDSVVEQVQTPDGLKQVVRDAKKVLDRTLYHARLHLEFAEDEALYGLGSHEEGVLNLRGTRTYVHQANMKIAMPFFVSTNGYGLLMDTYAPLVFNDNEYGSYLHTQAVEMLDYYFIGGQNPEAVVQGYRALTGSAPMLPRWAFGYIQSQERYESAQELVDTVREYRRRQIPLDGIVLDWQSWEDGQWGQKSFDRTRFPNPSGMMDALHQLGARLMISIWPNMITGSRDYLEMQTQGCLLPQSEIYDAFSEKARKLYWEQANRELFASGIDAWWCDSSEPFTPEWNTAVKPEPDANLLAFHQTASRHMRECTTNAYPLCHAQTMYEGQRSVTEDKRVVNLTRSGYTGAQRYGTILWSGDTSAKWETLKKQIPAGLNACAAGIPYWTLDIGAFFVKKGHTWFWDGDFEAGTEDLGYRELYTRWYQYGAFLPVFRSHGTDCRREIWHFGDPGDMFYESLATATRLRYRLLPYLYACGAQVTLENHTMMRPLAFDFPHDVRTHNIDDQYLLGPSLLVCPVTTPMYYGPGSRVVGDREKRRTLYLPAGANWTDWHTGVMYAGGQTVAIAAPIDRIPVMVRAGSILPLAEPAACTDMMRQDEFDLRVYPGADGAFTLYLDAGDGYGYEQGQYATIRITWDDHAGTLTLHERRGSYPGMPERLTFRISGMPHEGKTVFYTGAPVITEPV